MKKPIVCVFFGGNSSEYFVSLRSAFSILESISKEKYEVVKIGIDRGGNWYIFDGKNEHILADTWLEDTKNLQPVTININEGTLISTRGRHRKIKPTRALLALHGRYGEDGQIQSLLNMAKIKFCGCDFLSSMLSWDKHLTKLAVKEMDVRVARDVLVRDYQLSELDKIYTEALKIGYPVFVKPTKSGSSVGVSRVSEQSELRLALEKAFKCSSSVLIEEAINGKECEIALVENDGEILVSRVGELSYNASFYSYDAKYKSKDSECKIPAEISEKTEKHLRECAKKLFLALGCRGYARMDFFVLENGEFVFNEINTLPGFTKISMFPKLFQFEGYSMKELLDLILK